MHGLLACILGRLEDDQMIDARLTDEELAVFDLRDSMDDAYGVSGEQLKPVADAQLRKAITWAAQFIENSSVGEGSGLAEWLMEAAGIVLWPQ